MCCSIPLIMSQQFIKTCVFIACRMKEIPFIKLGYIQRSQKSVMDATGLVQPMRCVSFLYPTSLIVNMLPNTPSLSFKFLAGLYEWNSNNERCFLNSWFLDWWQTSVTGAIYVTPPLILMYLYTCIHIGGLSLIVIYYS